MLLILLDLNVKDMRDEIGENPVSTTSDLTSIQRFLNVMDVR